MKFKNRTPLKKFGGGGTNLINSRLLSCLRTYILTVLFLIANTLSFAKVPHSYVTENPKKEIQKVETFKQREKAELNLSVTKLKTKEIEGKLVNGKLVIDITDKKDIQEGNVLVTQGTPYKPNNARVRNANATQILETNKEANKLEVTGENLQDVYVNVLDSKGQLVGVYINKENLFKSPRGYDGITNIELTNEYNGDWIIFNNSKKGSFSIGYAPIKKLPIGMKLINHTYGPYIYNEFLGGTGDPSISYLEKWWINNINIRYERINKQGAYYQIQAPLQKMILSSELEVEYKYVLNENLIYIRLLKYPTNKNFHLTHKFVSSYFGENEDRWYGNEQTINFKVPETLKGNSTLTFAEYYPVNEFVQFTANPTIQNAQPLALDNSVRDVTLETTGKGLVSMQQGDKLTVDGHQVVIGAGGNIGLQKLTIGNVKYTYEVKNGKFRIALNEWGVLEPNRTIPIKIVRTENGKDKSLAEHNLTIKAPRRVEGTSNVKLNQDYSIRNTIRFNGISLQGAGALGLENPIPLGVSLTSTAGQGIPFMKEGDRLEISDGLTTRSTYSTRGVKAFTIGSNGTLGKQQVKLNNGELTVFVEGGKLRVGVNNWLVNNTINSNVRLVRGTNEIMNHTLDIKVPEAPFNIKKNGLLDFGNVTSGSKRTAETDIVLEMLKDVSDVKFSLKDPQPMLENLGTGDNLKVNRIEYLVSKQGKRDYKVKLKGNLTIPEGTKSGLYTGSTVLELKIK